MDDVKIIEVKESIFSENEKEANELRARLCDLQKRKSRPVWISVYGSCKMHFFAPFYHSSKT